MMYFLYLDFGLFIQIYQPSLGYLMSTPSLGKNISDTNILSGGKDKVLFTQPLRSGRIWHKVNF